jgi:hypothetical protein
MTNQHTDSVLIQQMEILKGDNTMTKTPDYNDGEIHWWNRYATPEGLHPKSTVKIASQGGTRLRIVEDVEWCHVDAFQVITPHVEPRAWWTNVYLNGKPGALYKTKQEALKWGKTNSTFKTIRVVEQPESDT